MKKFTQINENKETPSETFAPKNSLIKVLEYIGSDEEYNFLSYISSEIYGYDEKEIGKQFEDQFNEIEKDDLQSLLKLLEKFDLYEEMSSHIFLHIRSLENLSSKMKPTVHYMKKINQ